MVNFDIPSEMTFGVRSLEAISDCRAEVREHLLDHDVNEDLIYDVQLACSELVTNGFMHAEAVEATVVLRVEGDEVVLTVSYPDTGVIAGRTASMSDVGQRDGRGTAIIDKLASSVRTEMTDNWRTATTAVFSFLQTV